MTRTHSTPLAEINFDSPVGSLTIIVSETGLAAVLWPTEREGRVVLAATGNRSSSHDRVIAVVTDQLDKYFAGTLSTFDVPLDPVGTDFQQAVWAKLYDIDFGTTKTYGEVAASLGSPKASRAVGAATGKNPISIIVPCHRVVGASGALTGFAGGLDAKRALLELEGHTAATFGSQPRSAPAV
ncbi:MAG: methylated-DNA--[protein]-cysteine S-methyltransferase [Actinobacteria bacterium]|nr:methylated-DNA--[protein]-cysteine S-methyltransferase [Actinomycetota bacterium]